MSWKRSALRLLVVVVALMTIAGTLGPVGATAAAEGQPEPPHRFFGTVTDTDGDAVTDATVEVVYDGEVVNWTTTDGNGYYDLTVAAPDSGEQVTIRVADTDASEQYEWQSGGSTEHDFENVQDPTTPTPTTTLTTTTTTTTEDDDDGSSPGGGGVPPSGGDDTTTTTPDSTTEQGIQDPTTTGTRQGDAPTTDETSTDAPTTDETDTMDATETTETTTDEDDDGGILDVPGFGVSVALVALVAAALLAVRRSGIDN